MSDRNLATLRLNGPFCLTGRQGQDLTPKNRKAQALLALLATAPALKRTRSWLQDKLWSRSAAQQGSASLRQTLSAIRRVLNTEAEILVTSRLDVLLNPDLIDVIWEKDESGGGEAFLEGLDIADPEFEDWLRQMRRGAQAGPRLARSPGHDAPRWKVAIVCEDRDGGESSREVAETLARVLREQGEVEVAQAPEDSTRDRLLHVRYRTILGKDGEKTVRLSADDPALNRQICADTASLAGDDGSGGREMDFFGLSFRLQTEITRYVAREADRLADTDCPPLILGAAIPRIFSFQPTELTRAANMLSDGMDNRSAAQFLGWQAQIAVINLIEQFTDAPEACVEQGKTFAAQAIEMAPMNSVVLSTAANAQVLLDRGEAMAGADLAELAVRVNPANPLAWWAYANVALYSDNVDQALQSARVAARLARRTPLQFWCDCQLGLAALKAGDIETARRALELSASLAPQFRPPRRYLLAIYAHDGQFAKAARMLVQLKKLEPDFSLDEFVNNDKYPVGLLRKSRMLDPRHYHDIDSPA